MSIDLSASLFYGWDIDTFSEWMCRVDEVYPYNNHEQFPDGIDSDYIVDMFLENSEQIAYNVKQSTAKQQLYDDYYQELVDNI